MKFDGERLHDMRIAKGISQDTLAEMVGTSRVCISNWEKNINQPALESIGKLGEALGVAGTFFIKEG